MKFSPFFYLAIILVLVIYACRKPTYNQTNKKSYASLLENDYESSLKYLDKNKYLKKKSSEILYLMEKGRLQLLAGKYKEAFVNLETASLKLDSWKELKERDVAGGIHTETKTETRFGTISNSSYTKPLAEIFTAPRFKTYRPSHYERLLIHYYKAICLIQLNRIEDAEVEAKQINQLSLNLDDLKNAESFVKKYVSDPFPQMISGIIYELLPDENSAFIAYENAYKKMEDEDTPRIYGNSIPKQLRKDILRLSYRLNFDDRLQQYESHFNDLYRSDSINRSLIVLIDHGIVPYKKEDLSWHHMRNGNLYPGMGNGKNSMRFSKPEFIPSPKKADPVVSVATSVLKTPEKIYTLDYITTQTYNKRFKIESEYYIKKCFRADTVFNQNSLAPTCDTRNWQSLPEYIAYVKLPVDTGWNAMYIKHQSGKTDSLRVYINRRNNFYYYVNQ